MVAHTKKHQRRLMRALAQNRNASLLRETVINPIKQQYFTAVLREPPLLMHFVESEEPGS